MAKSHSFTPEALQAFDKKKVQTIRENAVRLGAEDLIAMCDAELAARAPAVRARSSSSSSSSPRTRSASPAARANAVVTGYHFVCERNAGVVDLGDGRFWSGSWVVPEANVDKSLTAGAYLALHEGKTRPSYRQGKIVGYRKAPQEDGSDNNGSIEFLVESQPKSRAWVGAGAGETGYKWGTLRDED